MASHTTKDNNAPGPSSGKPKLRPIQSKGIDESTKVPRSDHIKEAPSLRKQQQEKLTQMSLRIQELEKAIAKLTKDKSPTISAVPKSAITSNSGIHLEPSSPSDSEKEDIMNSFLLDDQDMQDDSFEYSIIHLQDDRNLQFNGSIGTSPFYEDHIRVYKELTQRHIVVSKIVGFQSEEYVPSDSDHHPPHIFLQSLTFPCPPRDDPPLDILYFIPYLPSYERVQVLLDNYLHHFAWSCMVATPEDLENLIDFLYPSKTKVTYLKMTDGRKLALLWIICMFGTLFDLSSNVEEVAGEAQRYHVLARATLASYCFSIETTIEALQALVLMICFYRVCPGGSTRFTSTKERWILAGPVFKLFQGIGLDRDSRQFSADNDKCNLYERLVWEFNVVDIWQSFAVGRPTTVPRTPNACQVPKSVKCLASHKSEFYIWKYEFSRSLAGLTCLGVEQPAVYTDVLAFEKRIQTFPIPASLEWHDKVADDELAGVRLQSFTIAVYKQLALLYLHRPYFWHATSKNCSQRNALLLSHSVAIVYNSACTIITLTKEVWHKHPQMVARMTPTWDYCQTAMSMLGVLIIRNPQGPFAKNAFQKLEMACEIFLNAKGSFFPGTEIEELMSMRKAVQEILDKSSHSRNVPESPT